MIPDLLATKLFHAALSAIGFLLGIIILRFGRPGITVRTGLVSLSALVLIMAILCCGDLFSTEPAMFQAVQVPFLKQAGWLALGLLFGAGRGDIVVRWLDQRDSKSHGSKVEELPETGNSSEPRDG